MTRKSKPKRTCKLCKPHKYLGNSKWRQKASVRRQIQRGE